MKRQGNSGFTLIEMMIGVGLFTLIVFGASRLIMNSQQNSVKETLRKNQLEATQDLLRRMNHEFKRSVSRTVTKPEQLVLSLPSGKVIIETRCVPNSLDFQDPGSLLSRCLKCGSGERQIVQMRGDKLGQTFPGLAQRPDLPAGASVCFKQGLDPDEVEFVLDVLSVDPVSHLDKKVSRTDSILIKENSKVTNFE